MHDNELIRTFCAEVKRVDGLVFKLFHNHCRFKKQWSAHQMWKNESDALKLLSGKPGIQKIVDSHSRDMTIISRYAGHQLRKDDCTYEEAQRQGRAIIDVLREAELEHRDIRPDNLCYRQGQITLIDFQWAFFKGCIFRHREDAPRQMGGRYRGREVDDSYSMHKSLKHIWR